jgi:hypothetical protein
MPEEPEDAASGLRKRAVNKGVQMHLIYIYSGVLVVLDIYNTTRTYTFSLLSLHFEIGKRLEPSNFKYTGTAEHVAFP